MKSILVNAFLLILFCNAVAVAAEGSSSQQAQQNLQNFYEALERKKNEQRPNTLNDADLEREMQRINKETQKNNTELTLGRSLPETKEKQLEIEKGKIESSKKLLKKEEVIYAGQFDLIDINNVRYANVDKKVLESKIALLNSYDTRRIEADINSKALSVAINAEGSAGAALQDSLAGTIKYQPQTQQATNQEMLANTVDMSNSVAKSYIKVKEGAFVSERIYVKSITQDELKLAVK